MYYWKLPPRFLGDKITSYGGSLSYVLRHVPVPGGQSSRNSAPDIELISVIIKRKIALTCVWISYIIFALNLQENKIRLLHYSRENVEPNTLKTTTVKLLEQNWQRTDGQITDREHLLMALADLSYILIKATYTTGTKEVAYVPVSYQYVKFHIHAYLTVVIIAPAGYSLFRSTLPIRSTPAKIEPSK